jgi:hypothetical protein
MIEHDAFWHLCAGAVEHEVREREIEAAFHYLQRRSAQQRDAREVTVGSAERFL